MVRTGEDKEEVERREDKRRGECKDKKREENKEQSGVERDDGRTGGKKKRGEKWISEGKSRGATQWEKGEWMGRKEKRIRKFGEREERRSR